jgi:hypothetical protein
VLKGITMTHTVHRREQLKTACRRSAAVGVIAIASLMSSSPTAEAQDTRAQVIRQAQEDHQQQLTPPKLNGVERAIDRLEDWGLIAGQPRGIYPWFGSVYPGGGFAGGAGIRRPFGDDGALNVFGGYSIATFGRVQADLELPTFANNRARVTVSGSYVDAPDVRYFGIGDSSQKEDETRFGYTPTRGGARLDVDLARNLTVGGGVTYAHIKTSEGKTDPSIETIFASANTLGFELSKYDYVTTTAQAAYDWRRRPGYSGSGGLYRVQFDDHRNRDDVYSFNSLEAEARQLIPIFRANWVIALRGMATITDLDDTNAVPYFLLPSLGGGTTLRGYPDFRFRDRNRILMNAELRWTPARFIDMAIFYDTGKVTARHEDLDFNDLKESYGIGARLIGVRGYVLRLEVAHSRENNLRILFNAGGSF